VFNQRNGVRVELSFNSCKDGWANAISAEKLRMRTTANKHHKSMASFYFEFVDQQKISRGEGQPLTCCCFFRGH
jgi:hypothetical protein